MYRQTGKYIEKNVAHDRNNLINFKFIVNKSYRPLSATFWVPALRLHCEPAWLVHIAGHHHHCYNHQ